MGGFIQFKGATEGSSRAGTRLAAVKGRTSPGSKRLQVSSCSAGKPDEASLLSYIHAYQFLPPCFAPFPPPGQHNPRHISRPMGPCVCPGRQPA